MTKYIIILIYNNFKIPYTTWYIAKSKFRDGYITANLNFAQRFSSMVRAQNYIDQKLFFNKAEQDLIQESFFVHIQKIKIDQHTPEIQVYPDPALEQYLFYNFL